MKRLMIVVGTRPEVIKLAPVVFAARAHGGFEVKLVSTSQHRQLLDQMLGEFDLTADLDLDLMRPNQDICDLATGAMRGLYAVIDDLKPDVVIVQGDTSTTFAGALAANYRRVKVAHVEAGLRTYDKGQPFPEEINRTLVTPLTDYHFAPTTLSKANLLRENVPAERIWVTGNTAIDALLYTASRLPPLTAAAEGRLILVTCHRRENQGAPMEEICLALRDLLQRYPDARVLLPVHPNPNVKSVVERVLGNVSRAELVEPIAYRPFVDAMRRAHLILTDSGGIQEEAPALGKPVLVLRNTTERPEAIEAGTAKLVGTKREDIVREAVRLMDDPAHYRSMATAKNPFGDGTAALQIMAALARG